MSEEPKPTRSKRKWLRRLLYLFVAVVFLFGLLFLTLQTPPAKRFMASQLTSALSEKLPWPVEIRGIGGFLPMVVSVDAIALGESGSPWLELEEATVNLNLLSLLGGQVNIERIGAHTLSLHDLPASEDADEAEEPIALPILEDLPGWIRLAAVRVDRVQIDEAVLGQPIAFDVSGAYLPEDTDIVRLNIQGLDDTDSTVSLKGGLRQGTVGLALDVQDSALVPALTGLEGPYHVSLSLNGPLSDTVMQLEVTQNEDAIANLDMQIGYGEPLALSGTADLNVPSELLPEAVLERFGNAFQATLDVSLADGEKVAIKDARITVEGGALSVSGSYSLEDYEVALQTDFSYDDFHKLTGQPRTGEAVPMHAEIPMGGSLHELSITPNIQVGGEPFLSGEVVLGAIDSIFGARGAVTVYPAVATTPAKFQPLLADGALITLDVQYTDGNATFENTRIQIGGTELALNGTANAGAKLLNIDATLRADDLGQFEPLAGIPLAGATTLALKAAGDANATSITGTLDVTNLTLNTVQAPGGQLQITLNAGGFPDALTERIAGTFNGDFPGFQPRPDVQRDLSLAGDFGLEALQRLTVDTLKIGDGNLALNAQGNVDLESRAADFTAALGIAQISDYAVIANLPWAGAVQLDARVQSGDTPGSIVGNVQGELSALSGLPDPADGLLGEAVSLNASARYDGTTVTVDEFGLEGMQVRANGSGALVLESRTVDARANIALADLAPLSSLAGRPLSGDTTLAIEVEGPLDSLATRGVLSGQDLDLDVLLADTAEINFDAQGIPNAISANINTTLVKSGETLDLSAVLGYTESRLEIENLALAAGENRVSVAGVLNTEALRGHGSIAAEAPNLASLKTWFTMPLEGSIALNATLAEDSGALTGQLKATQVIAGKLTLDQADGEFNVGEVFDNPSGTVSLAIKDIDAGHVHLASLNFTASGPPNGMDLALKTEGVYEEFTRFNVEAGGQFTNETIAFDLRDLKFGVEGFTFALRDSSMLSWNEGSAVLTPLVLQSEAGVIEASGNYGAEALDAKVTWTDVSLRLIELAGMDPLGGAVSGNITLTGSPAAPLVEIGATLADYHPDPGAQSPGLNARVSASYAEGALRADLAASVEGAAQFNGDADLPLRFSVSPWNVDLPQGKSLSARLKGNADLAALSPLLPIEGHALRGKLNADLTAQGRLDAPRLNGDITVDEGYYENGNTSTILNDLILRVQAEGDTLRIARLTANDTAGGTVSGEGYLTFSPDDGSPYAFKLTLDKPRLVYRDDMRAEGSGEIAYSGDADGAKLVGEVTVSPAYFTIPKGSGDTKVTTVEYTEANAAGEEEAEETESPFATAIDLTVNLPGKIFVAGTGLDSEWEGTLKIKNTTAEPAIEGVLRVKKGTLDFLGRLFSLADSTITFDGQTPPSPYLRIDAVTETEDVVAHVRMEGVADALNITLESEPSLPQDEILARVLFGQRLSDVSPVQALTLARYAPIFNKKQSGRSILGSQGPKPFLVDRVSLRSGTGAGDASIATGKYLNDDFYLEYEQGLGAAQSLISLEWLFAPHWSLKGKTTSQGQGGLGVFWKKEY